VTCRIVRLSEEPEFVGRAVCAIGVFDGVHTGHAALVKCAVELASRRGVECFAITFDRDPDQVVTPDSAAPQLLTLEAKAQLLCDAGADAVLVVPFTLGVAALSPDEFLTNILLSAVDPVAIVVGEDFRFGRYAAGTVETLMAFCEPRGIDVAPCSLVGKDGAAVTSTRIRALVAAGDVESASLFLGRPHRVAGTVVRGRGEGTGIGVPTANVAPVEFAALPGAGVYAGRVSVEDEVWPAAISVGRPPTFPEATDVLEAHLIGFDGDIYGLEVGVTFLARLRDQRPFSSVEQLKDAMCADIETASRIAGPAAHAAIAPDVLVASAINESKDYLDDGSPVVEDPAALEAAERAAAGAEPNNPYADFTGDWVEVLGPISLVAVTGPLTAFHITSPLAAEGIPFVWDPYDPQNMTAVRPELMSVKRFRLFVAPADAERARSILDPKWTVTES